MGGIPAKLQESLFNSLFNEQDGEVKPLQDSASKELAYTTALIERLQNIQNVYNTPKKETGSFLGSDPLNPGGYMGIGVDSGSWRDELGNEEKQGWFDNIASNIARTINPKGAETRQNLYDASSRLYDPIQLKSGAQIPDHEIGIYLGGNAPSLDKSKDVNMQRIGSALKDLMERQKRANSRLKSVHPGTDRTIDNYMNPNEISVDYPTNALFAK